MKPKKILILNTENRNFSVPPRAESKLLKGYEFPPLGGGDSPVSYEIAKGYVKKGHKVSVVIQKTGSFLSLQKRNPCF